MINTIKHLCYVLKSSEEELSDIISNIDQFYYKKVELKTNKDGSTKLDQNGVPKKRVLYPSTGKLKHIQKIILQFILNKIQPSQYAYGAVKGRDNVMNAKKHQGKKFVFTTDLKDFFPGISHQMVFDMFRINKFSPTVSRVLTKLTTYKGQVPQGAPTSPMIANLVFGKTGDKLETLSKKHNITFTTFIDDLTFSSSNDFKELTFSFLKIIRANGFKLSHKKTNYKTRYPIITGVLVKNNSIDVPKSLKEKLQNPIGLSTEQIAGISQYASKIKSTNR